MLLKQETQEQLKDWIKELCAEQDRLQTEVDILHAALAVVIEDINNCWQQGGRPRLEGAIEAAKLLKK